jgi:hypothetical protein
VQKALQIIFTQELMFGSNVLFGSNVTKNNCQETQINMRLFKMASFNAPVYRFLTSFSNRGGNPFEDSYVLLHIFLKVACSQNNHPRDLLQRQLRDLSIQ